MINENNGMMIAGSFTPVCVCPLFLVWWDLAGLDHVHVSI